MNADGSVDPNFDPGADNTVQAIALQPDGNMIVGGLFTTIGGGGSGVTTRIRLARLTSTGAVDPTFNSAASDHVFALGIQADGKILVGGSFTSVGTGSGVMTRNRIARLNSDGSVDPTFNPGADGTIFTLAIQSEGAIIAAGSFTHFGGGGTGVVLRNSVGRVNSSGEVDQNFNPGRGGISSIALQKDGKVVVGGQFGQLGTADGGSVGRLNIGRISQSTGVSDELRIDETSATISWTRGGNSSVLSAANLEHSTDGQSFIQSGTGTRADAGWTFDASSLPISQILYLRARGSYRTAEFTGSQSLTNSVKQILRCPALTVTPASGSLTPAAIGTPYTQQFSQIGGFGSVKFSRLSGMLPSGLSVNGITGQLSGVPTQAGPFSFSIESQDENGCFGVATYTLAVASTLIQFSAPNYNVDEGATKLDVTVTRTGDTSGVTTVDYFTSDTDNFTVNCSQPSGGNAFARCDFATSVDTLTFTAGQTSKTFAIPIINDAIAEGNETFTVVLSNVTGGTLGTPLLTTITINDNDVVTGANPIFTTPFFVRQHYLDFLSREPEVGEPWSNVLNTCSDVNNNPDCDRLTVSGAFFGSPEFQLKGYFTYRFYKLAFNRLPLYTEIVVDMRAVTGATPGETFAKKAAFTNNFVARTEFTNLYIAMSNTQYVNTLMGRYSLTSITTPDPGDPDGTTKVTLTTADLINQLNAATWTRAQVLRAIADSDQVFNLEFNQGFVAMQYFGYLRRNPDTAGFNAWLLHLNTHPGDSRTMVNGFMNSTEYRLRFGPPNP